MVHTLFRRIPSKILPLSLGFEQGAEVARRKRPDAERPRREWARFAAPWEAAAEEEREELMQALGVRVEVNQKEKGTCKVALLPQVPSSDGSGNREYLHNH